MKDKLLFNLISTRIKLSVVLGLVQHVSSFHSPTVLADHRKGHTTIKIATGASGSTQNMTWSPEYLK